MIRVQAWLLKEAIANVPDDDYVDIDETTLHRLVVEQCDRRGTTLTRTRRDARGRFLSTKRK